MCAYVNYPFKRVPKMAGGGATPWNDIATTGAGIGSSLIDGLEGDYPTAWGGAGSGALSGAAAGTAILPGIGTAVGAVIGGVAGFFGGKSKEEAARKQREAAMQQRQEMQYAAKLGSSRQQLQSYPTQGLTYAPFLMGKGGITPTTNKNPTRNSKPRSPLLVNRSGNRVPTFDPVQFILTAPTKATQPQGNSPAFTPGWAEKMAYDHIVPVGYELSNLINSEEFSSFKQSVADQLANPYQKVTGTWDLNRNDAWRAYLGMAPQGKALVKQPDNSYKLHDDIEAQILASTLNYPSVKVKSDDSGIMGHYVPVRGKDAKGSYVAYSDNWDLDPDVMGVKVPVEKFVGKPFDVKGRIYYDPATGKRVPAKAAGGYAPPLYKAEGGEVIEHLPADIPQTDSRGLTRLLSNDTSLIVGDKHTARSGGISMSNKAPARIFSDQLHASPELTKRINHF